MIESVKPSQTQTHSLYRADMLFIIHAVYICIVSVYRLMVFSAQAKFKNFCVNCNEIFTFGTVKSKLSDKISTQFHIYTHPRTHTQSERKTFVAINLQIKVSHFSLPLIEKIRERKRSNEANLLW